MKTTSMNPLQNPSAGGYYVSRSQEIHQHQAIGPIDENGDYETVCPGDPGSPDLAVYPTRATAEAAIKRAAGDSDPLCYDGLRVRSLRRTRSLAAAQCAVYGYVCYPDGKPPRIDYDSFGFWLGK